MGDLFGCAQARTDENIHVFEFSITRWLLSGPVLFVFIRELDGTGIAVACGGSSARNNRGEVDGASRGMPTSELDTERGSLYYSAPWWHVLPKRRVGYCAVVLAAMVTRDWVRQRGQYIVAAGVNMESCMVLRMHERARFTVYRRGVDGDEIHLGDNVDLAKRLHCLIDGTPTPIAFVSARRQVAPRAPSGGARRTTFKYAAVLKITGGDPFPELLYQDLLKRNDGELKEMCKLQRISGENCGNKVRRARAIALKVTYPEKFVGQDPSLYR